MATITKQEVLKLAEMSQIHIQDDEIEQLTAKLDAVLTYASRLIQVAQGKVATPLPHNSNVTRQDKVVSTDPEPLLALAPARESMYYSVPMILKNN